MVSVNYAVKSLFFIVITIALYIFFHQGLGRVLGLALLGCVFVAFASFFGLCGLISCCWVWIRPILAFIALDGARLGCWSRCLISCEWVFSFHYVGLSLAIVKFLLGMGDITIFDGIG